MLPHFKNTDIAKYPHEPVYRDCYEIFLFYNDDTKLDDDHLRFIQDNIVRYDLRKGKIIVTLNMLEECSITKMCAIFDDVKQIVITVHNSKGEIKRKMTMDSPKNSLDDFSFVQDLNDHDKLANLNVTIKYTEITSEIIT